MNELENEYNKRFKNEEMPNDDFDVEGLWDEVEKELDEEPNRKIGFPFRNILLLGLLLLFVTGSIMLFNYSNTTGGLVVNENEGVNGVENFDVNDAGNENATNEDEEFFIVDEINKSTTNIESDHNQDLGSKQIASFEKNQNFELTQNTFSNSSKNTDHEKSTKKDQLNGQLLSDQASPDSGISNTDFANKIKSQMISNETKNKDANVSLDEFKKSINTFDEPKLVNPDNDEEPEPVILKSDIDKEYQTGEKGLIVDTKTDISEEIEKPKSEATLAEETKAGMEDKEDDPEIEPTIDFVPEEVTQDEMVELPNDSKIEAVVIDSLSSDLTDSNKEKELAEAIQSNKNIKFELGLYAGMNSLMLNFQSTENPNLANEKNSAESISLGNTIGLKANLVWKKKWLLQTGAEYNNLWTKLDYNQQDSVILSDTVLVKVLIDGATGATVRRFYTDSLFQLTSRKVLHYNNFRMLSIPLKVGFQRRNGKWSYGFTAGAVFNFVQKQSGKTIDESMKVVEFTKNDSVAPLKNFQIGLSVSPYISYLITQKLAVRIEPKWSYFNGAVFNNDDFKVSIQQLNLNVGVGLSF